jgi:hypothetical protein
VKTYSGKRRCGVPLVLVHRDDGARVLSHAAAGDSVAKPFDWGRPRTGTRRLAAALAADLLRVDPPAVATVMALERIVLTLPDEWSLCASDLIETLDEAGPLRRAHS